MRYRYITQVEMIETVLKMCIIILVQNLASEFSGILRISVFVSNYSPVEVLLFLFLFKASSNRRVKQNTGYF